MNGITDRPLPIIRWPWSLSLSAGLPLAQGVPGRRDGRLAVDAEMAGDLTGPPAFGVGEAEDLGLDRNGPHGHPPFGPPSWTPGPVARPLASRIRDPGRIQGGKGLIGSGPDRASRPRRGSYGGLRPVGTRSCGIIASRCPEPLEQWRLWRPGVNLLASSREEVQRSCWAASILTRARAPGTVPPHFPGGRLAGRAAG